MRTGRPKQPLVLDPADREKLTLLARRPKTAQRVAVRAKIVLRAAEGLTNQAIALQLGITGATVGKWRERYRVQGMKGLADDSRPRHAAPDHRCAGGGGCHPNAGERADGGHTLEYNDRWRRKSG